MSQIRVLIVDDSALIRQMLSSILDADPAIEVVGTASDPYAAREKIKRLNPDVLTLDVEMPRMDGVSFLRNLMRLRPMPVVMVSSLTESGADITLEALSLGAVDFVTKPKIDVAHTFDEYSEEIVSKVKLAARSRVRSLHDGAAPREAGGASAAPARATPRARAGHLRTTERIVAIGASTGGTEAIREVMQELPADTPGIVIVQHIPEAFSAPFAKRLNAASAMVVAEARDGQQILPGHAYVAPGNAHLSVVRNGARYECRLSDAPPVNRHRPSVDVLFDSVAEHVGPNAVGVILTGMGDDGAAGLARMLAAGAGTIAQDESTSVVWGMPGQAVRLGAASSIVPLPRVARAIAQALEQGAASPRPLAV